MPLITATSKMATFDNTDSGVGGAYNLLATAPFEYVKGRTYLLFLFAQYAVGGYGATGAGRPVTINTYPDFSGPAGGWFSAAGTYPTNAPSLGWVQVGASANTGLTRQLMVYVYQPTVTTISYDGMTINLDEESSWIGLAGNIVEYTNCDFRLPIRISAITTANTLAVSNSQALASVGKPYNAMAAYGARNINEAMTIEAGWSATGANNIGTLQNVSTQATFRNDTLDAGRNCTLASATSTTGSYFICELMANRYPMVSIT